MSFIRPLSHSVKALVDDALRSPQNLHPGLVLDKYAKTYSEDTGTEKLMKAQHAVLKEVVGCKIEQESFSVYDALRKKLLDSLHAEQFEAECSSPLTLHLSRASALENAGICLHHVHGFAYLPGSGLKGMARAWAETVWLAGKPKAEVPSALEMITRIFGSAVEAKEKSAGEVVFHDAWPVTPPVLFVDILNCHHAEYYKNEGKAKHAGAVDFDSLPGDWENPIPVYFLAIPAGSCFHFALSKRGGCGNELIGQAKEFLLGALCYRGAGAKTAAGYGRFKMVPGTPKLPDIPECLATYSGQLTLCSPAFLAGAEQGESDCRLRGATLRGQLRWWWRTMHAGYVSSEQLAEMESAVWGSSSVGSAVAISLKDKSVKAKLFQYKEEKDGKPQPRPTSEFRRNHKLGVPPDNKTTQGLFYMSYGMDEWDKKAEVRKSRYFVEAGFSWTIDMTARSLIFPEKEKRPIPAEVVIEQAKLALYLLCCFGGVGSKARKGYGSLRLGQELDYNGVLGEAIKAAATFRLAFLGNSGSIVEISNTPSLEHREFVKEWKAPWHDPWFAIDQLGFALQGLAKRYAHKMEKVALGLPRKGFESNNIHRITSGKNVDVKNFRDPSPVHFHLEQREDGMLVRAIAFPSPFMPDHNTLNP